MLVDRSRRAPASPWLEWKVRFFVIGAMLALGGMAMGMEWLIWLALVFLTLGFLTRFIPIGKGGGDGESGHDDDAHRRGSEEVRDEGNERDWWASS